MCTSAIRKGAINAIEANQKARRKKPRSRGIISVRLIFSVGHVFVQRVEERDEPVNVRFADSDARQFLIALTNLAGASHFTESHQFSERAFNRRKPAGVHVRLREREIAKRRRLERGNHSLQESIVGFAGSTELRRFHIDEVPEAQVRASRFLTRRSLAKLWRRSPSRARWRNLEFGETALAVHLFVFALADSHVVKREIREQRRSVTHHAVADGIASFGAEECLHSRKRIGVERGRQPQRARLFEFVDLRKQARGE